MMRFSAEDMKDGLERLGLSRDAKFLRQRLMEVLVATSPPTLSDGAVRHLEGRRSFAAELIGALGLNREVGSSDGSDDGAEHVAAGRGQPVRTAGAGLRSRVPEHAPGREPSGK